MTDLRATIKQIFNEKHGKVPGIIARAPGRINIIGEHTDYNGGYVLPGAINMEMIVALAKNNTREIKAYAINPDESGKFSLDQLYPQSGWINYIMGVTAEMLKKGVNIEGYDVVFGGNIPVGSGLSSSAALECSLATGLNELFQGHLDKGEIAKLSQMAEHHYAGVMCGIMDQFASVFGKENNVIKLECRTMAHEYHPINLKDHSFLLLDTNVKHSLAGTEYNNRKHECQEGVKALQKNFNNISDLRDASLDMLNSIETLVDPVVYKRCAYVIKENQRVVNACKALDVNDLNKLGELMYGSHDGLQHEYEVSCKELDFLVDQAHSKPSILGARMMGGGFGGCTINLIENSAINNFVDEVGKKYKEAFNLQLKHYLAVIGAGAGIL